MKKSTILGFAKLVKDQPNKVATAGSVVKYGLKYGLVGLRHKIRHEIWLNRAEEPKSSDVPGQYNGGIKFSIIMPTFNVDIKWVDKAISSVKNQTFSNWELCIVDDCSTSSELISYLQELSDDKIRIKMLSHNMGISGATNEALKLASGDYYVLLDNDDELKEDALFELFLKASTTHADIIYTDNDVIDSDGQRLAVLHKPDWSPDLILSQMYVGHLLAFKKALVDSVGGFRKAFDGAQDYDLFLRIMDKANSIEHIAKVLYSWRSLPSSTATNPNSKPYAQTAGRKALQSYLDSRYGLDVVHAEETEDLFVYDVRYPIPDGTYASIIIPTKDHVEDLAKAISSILSKTSYKDFEIIIINNNSELDGTNRYFKEVSQVYSNIKVVDAPISFNWSKLNNLAVNYAKGDVLVFLNNDTEVIAQDWLTRLVENSIRNEIGIVGGLLLYPDGLIQHAGVVLGMGGWADHVYKGSSPIHYGNPFISPMVARNVSAVTGACMAVSRNHFEMLGGFDESFIVCGSDVELCIHALKIGLRNVYLPRVCLHHYESKTRDCNDIPDIDFELSKRLYDPYLKAGDPFYNQNLDYKSCIPTVLSQRERLRRGIDGDMPVGISEIRPLRLMPSSFSSSRLNLFLPSINPEDIYGGISTALNFFDSLASKLDFDLRIILLDADPRKPDLDQRFSSFAFVALGNERNERRSIVSAFNRESKSLPWGENDFAVCTCWWSAFCMQESMAILSKNYAKVKPLIYLIQDFEPGFYSWSSRYLLADSTYRSSVPTYAVFNSVELKDYFSNHGYSFNKEYCFNPSLNASLAKKLNGLGGKSAKRKQIILYGRPNTDRNAFELVIEMLRRWIEIYEDSAQWTIISAGEDHDPVYLSHGRYLTSSGKMTLDQYANVLSESSVGISLMVSPHPSYPPLEMASFGIKVITNNFENKNLTATFSRNIYSLESFSISAAVDALCDACSSFKSEVECGQVPSWYLEGGVSFPFVDDLAKDIFGQFGNIN